MWAPGVQGGSSPPCDGTEEEADDVIGGGIPPLDDAVELALPVGQRQRCPGAGGLQP